MQDLESYDQEQLERLSALRNTFDRTIDQMEDRHRRRISIAKKHVETLEEYSSRLIARTEWFIADQEKENRKEILKLKERLAAAEAEGPRIKEDPMDRVSLAQAKTFAIFDSIIFAISNWSDGGDTAPDFELACQAVLFPVIFERVMKEDADYYIPTVPVAALEVVDRGRAYVKHFRESCHASLVDPEVWEENSKEIYRWWIGDALPLLYGGRSDDWDDDEMLSLDEIIEWKENPASRALRFPLIFDGMELVEKYRDQIRESTRLPDFNRQTLQTRLKAHE